MRVSSIRTRHMHIQAEIRYPSAAHLVYTFISGAMRDHNSKMQIMEATMIYSRSSDGLMRKSHAYKNAN